MTFSIAATDGAAWGVAARHSAALLVVTDHGGYAGGSDIFGKADPSTALPLEGDLALADRAGIENLEERLLPGRVDPLVLTHLRTVTAS